jgi:hypothetical protein
MDTCHKNLTVQAVRLNSCTRTGVGSHSHCARRSRHRSDGCSRAGLHGAFCSSHQRSAEAQRGGQITDRYNAAITNLDSTSEDIRLGGIYALRRVRTHHAISPLSSQFSALSSGITRLLRQWPGPCLLCRRHITLADSVHDDSTTFLDLDRVRLY